jgi:hypothetical protein
MTSSPGRLGPVLARGPRADVHAWTEARDPEAARVVKVYRGDHGRTSALATAAALAGLQHPHLVPLVGLVEVGSGRLGILLPKLSRATAVDWLDSRRVVSAGEAVTLLAPILLALLHVERRRLDPRLRFDASIDLSDVLFDERGAPVVTGVRVDAALSEVQASQAGAPSQVARRLVALVMAATVGGGSAARTTLAAVCAEGAEIDELLEVLFELADPVPIEAAPAPESDDTDPLRDDTVVTPGCRRAGEDVVADVEPRVLDDLVPGWRRARSILARTVRSSPRLERAVQSLRQVRPRVWATSGLLAASAVVGLTILPGTGNGEPTTPAPTTPTSTGRATVQPATTSPHTEPRQTGGTSADAPSRRDGSTPARPPASTPNGTTPVSASSEILAGDDADAAVRELIRLRRDCLRALDRDCLEGVEQSGSPISISDRSAVADPERLGDSRVDLRIDEAINRLGGAILFRATSAEKEPASVLVVRTEAGWRLRTIA